MVVLVYFVLQPSESRMDWYKMSWGEKKTSGGYPNLTHTPKVSVVQILVGQPVKTQPNYRPMRGWNRGPHWLRHRIPRSLRFGSVDSDIIRHCREQNCDTCHVKNPKKMRLNESLKEPPETMVNVGALIYVYTWDQKLIMGIGDVITVFESSMVQVFIDFWSPMNKNLKNFFVSPSIFRKNIAMPFIKYIRYYKIINDTKIMWIPLYHHRHSP